MGELCIANYKFLFWFIKNYLSYLFINTS